MGDMFRSSRLIALIAAHVVALQAVLLPLSALAAAPFAASLCSAHATANNRMQLPADSQSGCPCAAGCGTLCCAHAVLAAKGGILVTRAQAFGPAPAPVIRPLAVTRAADWRPQAPRGPPSA